MGERVVTRPDWDLDLGHGHDRERFVETCHRGTHEVKAPRYVDDLFYVELEQNPFGRGWRPSGLRISTADVWDFVKGWAVLSVPRGRLLDLVERGELGRFREETDGECPTRGRLLSWMEIAFASIPPRADGSHPTCVRCSRYGPAHLGAHCSRWPRHGDPPGWGDL